jgi:hypothetical protein
VLKSVWPKERTREREGGGGERERERERASGRRVALRAWAEDPVACIADFLDARPGLTGGRADRVTLMLLKGDDGRAC